MREERDIPEQETPKNQKNDPPKTQPPRLKTGLKAGTFMAGPIPVVVGVEGK